MAIVKAVNSRASIGNIYKYVTQKEKTEEKLLDGINCNPKTALTEMQLIKELYDKTDGRQYKHFVLSYPPGENIDLEKVRDNARTLVEGSEALKGHQVFIAAHKDKEHYHAHIIVNSVNFENGHKLQWSKKDLSRMKEHCNELSREQGLSIPEKTKDVTTWDRGKHQVMEKAFAGEYKSYVLDTANAVMDARQTATNREAFIMQMKEKGYSVEWSDKRKYITFKDKDGNKVRNSNLEKTFKADFSKEGLEREFFRNAAAQGTEERARTQLRAVGTDSPADGQNNRASTSNIEQERANRENRARDVEAKRREQELAEARRRSEERDRQARTRSKANERDDSERG